MKPHFAPGAPGKAHYSDTNYQLLGALMEVIDERPYRDDGIAGMLHGRRPFARPQAMASFGADGSMVSTATEQAAFLQAFMGGQLFPAEYVAELTAEWRRIFFPLQYGVGGG